MSSHPPVSIRRRTRARAVPAVVLLGIGVALAGSSLRAGSIEFGLGFSWTSPRFEGAYVHRFTPRFLDGTSTGSGGQALTFDQGPAPGLGFDVALFTSDRFGFRLSFDPMAPDIRGTSTPYQLQLQYPGGTTQVSEDFHGLTGSAKGSIWSLDAIYRVLGGRRPGPAIDLSAGVSSLGVRGTVNSVMASAFYVDNGHLRRSDIEYAVKYGSKSAIGWNAGLTASLFLGEQFALYADGRYFSFPRTTVPAEVVQLANVYEQPVDPSFFGITGGTAEVKPSYVRAVLGIKMAF